MNAAWIARARWRYRGALMWPAFVATAVADGLIGHALPINPPAQSIAAGLVVALVLNLIAIVLLSRPVGALVRRVRGDMPVVVARNYAGVGCVLLVTVGFVAVGLAKRPTIAHDKSVMHDAVVRASAYIGDHAPAQFASQAAHTFTYVIEQGSVYRTCVLNAAQTKDWCVIVDEHAGTVRYAGTEPNASLAKGDD